MDNTGSFCVPLGKAVPEVYNIEKSNKPPQERKEDAQ